MFSPVDVFVVPNEFFKRAAFDLVDSLVYLFEDFDIAVCYEGILKKSVQNFIQCFDYRVPKGNHLCFKLLLDLHSFYILLPIFHSFSMKMRSGSRSSPTRILWCPPLRFLFPSRVLSCEWEGILGREVGCTFLSKCFYTFGTEMGDGQFVVVAVGDSALLSSGGMCLSVREDAFGHLN